MPVAPGDDDSVGGVGLSIERGRLYIPVPAGVLRRPRPDPYDPQKTAKMAECAGGAGVFCTRVPWHDAE